MQLQDLSSLLADAGGFLDAELIGGLAWLGNTLRDHLPRLDRLFRGRLAREESGGAPPAAWAAFTLFGDWR